MNFTSFVTLALLGGIGGFAAGFLGVGGGVLLFPLLLYVPPLLGIESLERSMAEILERGLDLLLEQKDPERRRARRPTRCSPKGRIGAFRRSAPTACASAATIT